MRSYGKDPADRTARIVRRKTDPLQQGRTHPIHPVIRYVAQLNRHLLIAFVEILFQKTLDILTLLWYNYQVVRERSHETSGCGAAGSALPWGG